VTALAGRVAVVTGAARDCSIGGGVARVLARHGADVIVNDLEATEEGERRVGGRSKRSVAAAR
jgi:NAD(P)-dependent dehydrogenase (short-subunit alcohol dehydrogenase family)